VEVLDEKMHVKRKSTKERARHEERTERRKEEKMWKTCKPYAGVS
jgi:hypothetical protein